MLNFTSSAKSYREAVTFYTEMKETGIMPNVFTYNTFIHKSPDYQTALEWCKKIKVGKEHYTHN
jgi:pentatricopeptide repeat protein